MNEQKFFRKQEKKFSEMEVKKLFKIVIFLDSFDREGHQLTHRFTLESVSMGALENYLESKRLIRVPHTKGTGVTLVNMEHITEISIMEVKK
ncbi:hypothetical protein ABIC37_005381 [Priestia megaterium]|uniref:hypothetical protein n=1 Tax=Priestia megaterium TaxID=1404 RepID=UPI00339636C2